LEDNEHCQGYLDEKPELMMRMEVEVERGSTGLEWWKGHSLEEEVLRAVMLVES
jgi:hypothetical protein